MLNGSPAVSAATRRRVLDAIATLDYEPSPVARALSTGRTNAIAVVAPFFTQPSVIERLRGVWHTLANEGYQLILHDVERADQRRELFRSLAARGNIDGLLAISLAPTEREARRMLRAGVAVVLIDRERAMLPCITMTTPTAAGWRPSTCWRSATARSPSWATRRRTCSGFDSSAAAGGVRGGAAGRRIRTPPEWVLRQPDGRDAARVAAAELLTRSPRPTAVFAASDVQAIGVLEAAQGAGVPVPEQLSVIGFDNVEAADHGADHGRAAVGGDRPPRCRPAAARGVRRGGPSRRMPLEIVARGSTAPPRDSALERQVRGNATTGP